MNKKQKYEKHMKPKGLKRLCKWQRNHKWKQINKNTGEVTIKQKGIEQ